jgi:hypothetical protein
MNMTDCIRNVCTLAIALAPLVAAAGPCQQWYDGEYRKINARFNEEARTLGYKTAVANKAQALRKLNEGLHTCESMKPIGPAQMDPRTQWSSGGPGIAVYTDEKSQRWAFDQTVRQGAFVWTLQQTTAPRTNQMGRIREMYAVYREAQNRQQPKELRGRLL